jgi:hypothetical protein
MVVMCRIRRNRKGTRATPGMTPLQHDRSIKRAYRTALTEACAPWSSAAVVPPLAPANPVSFPFLGSGQLSYFHDDAADCAFAALIRYFTVNPTEYLTTRHIFIVLPTGGPRSINGKKYKCLRRAWE